MLALVGTVMIAVFMYLIMGRRLSPMVCLIVVPAAFAVFTGHAAELGTMVGDGITSLAPTAAMLMFAILYFGVMIDAGLFDPIARAVVRFTRNDPLRLLVGTVALVAVVSLDGDGSTTFMITVSALLPIYRRLGMSVVLMTGLAGITNGILNTAPWGGPTARAASALGVDPGEVFVPMLPALGVGLLAVFALAYVIGLRERRRLGRIDLPSAAPAGDSRLLKDAEHAEREPAGVLVGVGAGAGSAGAGSLGAGSPGAGLGGGRRGLAGASAAAAGDAAVDDDVLDPDRPSLRPRLLWFNATLTVALMVLLILGVLPIPVLFMLASAVALMVNYPSLADQRARIVAHSDSILSVVAMVFAAAVFTGVLSGTGMVEAMAQALLSVIPDSMGPYLTIITGLLSIPLTFLMSNDAFYFGVVPVIAETAAAHGISDVEIARASLVGQPVHMLSPLVPAVYVLIGLARVELADHHRFAIKWGALASLVILAAGVLFGTM
ncbi:CitMHS family transporter [Allostreptomyces psammosilenae]|uniref:CitMHS family citrate-Mg2+:H+ or citrate-Ca2+:H+ symporter n=1 Tax=Allostreptomyces psammosilenae TaxID=1892865 RepID=A0A852ZPX8_9ACTN|nr:citrate:proton symporter [Allostreptomyces psammosilenae]NYI03547.1 CitMHS family citrate-Mg2+:H+ or citrate-Ca2+:H+ symporter [Allostreptomyces psammosilenae]